MTLMFALLFGAQTGLALQRERTAGTLARLRAAPVSPFTLVAGKWLGNAAILVVQLAVMVAFSWLALSLGWGRLDALVLPGVAFALAASAFGAFCAAVTRTASQLSAFSILAVCVASALGGLWWPLETVPTWMEGLARLFPTYWGITALQDVILRGAGPAAVLPHTLILLGYAAVFLLVGSRAYRYD